MWYQIHEKTRFTKCSPARQCNNSHLNSSQPSISVSYHYTATRSNNSLSVHGAAVIITKGWQDHANSYSKKQQGTCGEFRQGTAKSSTWATTSSHVWHGPESSCVRRKEKETSRTIHMPARYTWPDTTRELLVPAMWWCTAHQQPYGSQSPWQCHTCPDTACDDGSPKARMQVPRHSLAPHAAWRSFQLFPVIQPSSTFANHCRDLELERSCSLSMDPYPPAANRWPSMQG